MLCQKSSTIGALLLTLSSVNAALTYWIDPNCPSDISRSIDEAKEGASRILNRWNNPVQGDTYLPFLRKTIWRDGPDTEISYNLLVPSSYFPPWSLLRLMDGLLLTHADQKFWAD